MRWLREYIQNDTEITLEDVIEKVGSKYSLLSKFKDTPQDKEWHAEGDVHIHTNMVIKETYNLFKNNNFSATEKFILIMAAIFHDIAKPLVTREAEINGIVRVIAPGHEQRGMSYLFYKFLDEEMSAEERTHILNLVGYHQKPKLLVIKNKSEWEYKALTQETPGYLFYYHETADMKGRTAHDLESSLETLEEFKMFCEEYNCFNHKSNIKSSIHNVLSSEFGDDTFDDYTINKTYTDLINGEYDSPFVGHSKYFSKRNNHSKLYILCGISGSGKSRASINLQKNNSTYKVLSLDELRKKHKVNNTNRKKVEGRVMQEAKTLLKELLAKNENIIYDACNIRKDFRKIIIDIANQYHAETTLVFIQTPLQKCIEHDKNRDSFLGDKIIKEQVTKFQYPEIHETNNYLII